MSEHTKPLPRITPDNQPFWDALRERKLVLPHCAACAKPHLPPGPVCPFCFADRLEWRPASGRGTVSTWTVVHKEWLPAFAADIPYNVVQVELEEGPRMMAHIVDVAPDPAALRCDLPLEVVFEDLTAEITLPKFRPVS